MSIERMDFQGEGLMTYRRHNCKRKHRTYLALARCIWRNAWWIREVDSMNAPVGTPCRFASVSYCRKPYIRGDQTTVYLHDDANSARAAKKWIDACGCGGGCQKNHRVIKLELEK